MRSLKIYLVGAICLIATASFAAADKVESKKVTKKAECTIVWNYYIVNQGPPVTKTLGDDNSDAVKTITEKACKNNFDAKAAKLKTKSDPFKLSGAWGTTTFDPVDLPNHGGTTPKTIKGKKK